MGVTNMDFTIDRPFYTHKVSTSSQYEYSIDSWGNSDIFYVVVRSCYGWTEEKPG